jgi:hypothetical protein
MDGGIQPERPEELGANELFGDDGNGTLFIGTKGKMMADTYGLNPRLLPTSRTAEVQVKQTIARVPEQSNGHYGQWIEGCIAGYGNTKLSSSFDVAGPLTEALLMANLAVRGHELKGGHIKMLWDNDNMKITNFDDVNQYIKRQYREGWTI